MRYGPYGKIKLRFKVQVVNFAIYFIILYYHVDNIIIIKIYDFLLYFIYCKTCVIMNNLPENKVRVIDNKIISFRGLIKEKKTNKITSTFLHNI